MIVCRWHWSRPRMVIPHQHIHFSVSPGDVYTPQATLAYGVHIPTLPQKPSGGLWTTGLQDEGVTLSSLLSDPQETLKYLGEVLLLLRVSKFHPLSTQQEHTIQAFKLSSVSQWTSNTQPAMGRDIYSRVNWF